MKRHIIHTVLVVMALVQGACVSTVEPLPVLFYPTVMSLTIDHAVTRFRDSTSERLSGLAWFRAEENGPQLPVTNTWVNGRPMVREDNAGTRYRLDPSGGATLGFDGRYNVWTVAGTDEIPGFIDSLRSPPTPTRIEYPKPGDTVSLSKGLTVRWNGSPDAHTRSSVLITNYDTYDQAAMLNGYDSGSYTFDYTLMKPEKWQSGTATIAVSRYITRDTLAPGRRRYTMGISTTDAVVVFLAP